MATSNGQVSYGGGFKRRWRSSREPLEVRCLRDGSLDIDLETGVPFNGKTGRKYSMWVQEDHYVSFQLCREIPKGSRIGKRKKHGRYREHRRVLVHRLVMMKKLAVAIGGSLGWRSAVCEIPNGFDVDHWPNVDPRDNRGCNLRLLPYDRNRGRHDVTAEEAARLSEFV